MCCAGIGSGVLKGVYFDCGVKVRSVIGAIFGILVLMGVIHCRLVFASEVGATLCEPHEEVYFSCLSRRRIISVCASGNTSPERGYVKYRFGTRLHLEVETPSDFYPPGRRVLVSEFSGGSVDFVNIRFKIRDCWYVVFIGDSTGVYVKKSGKLVARHWCDDGEVYRRINYRLFRGVYTVAPIFGIDG